MLIHVLIVLLTLQNFTRCIESCIIKYESDFFIVLIAETN